MRLRLEATVRAGRPLALVALRFGAIAWPNARAAHELDAGSSALDAA